MVKEFNKDLLCKDCKNVQASFMSRLTNFTYGFKCTLPESWNKPEFDPVVGETKEGYFHTAGLMRSTYEACGPDAKKWVQDTESAIREGRHFKTTEAKKKPRMKRGLLTRAKKIRP
jgi:hypothetical protein